MGLGASNRLNSNLAPPAQGGTPNVATTGPLVASASGGFSTSGNTTVQLSAGWLAVLAVALLAYTMWAK